MADEWLAEWCVARVKEWLATGHPSAWRAWAMVAGVEGERILRVNARVYEGGKWSFFRSNGQARPLAAWLVPESVKGQRARANDAMHDILPGWTKSSEEIERLLLEEAAAIATAPQDWRTVEMLPEDYYAL